QGQRVEELGLGKVGICEAAPIPAAGGADDPDADEGCGKAPAVEARAGAARHCGALGFWHVLLDGAPCLDIVHALRARHEMQLEVLLRALIKTTRDVRRRRQIRFETHVVHEGAYPSVACAARLGARDIPCLRRISPNLWRARHST